MLERCIRVQYPRKDKYKNCQRKSGKSDLVTNEGATVNTWTSFTMVLKGTYLLKLIFLEKCDLKGKNCRDQNQSTYMKFAEI